MKTNFPERGRNNQSPKDSYTSRLNSAITADPHHVTWHRPEHRSDGWLESVPYAVGDVVHSYEHGAVVITESSDYMDGLRFGGDHER